MSLATSNSQDAASTRYGSVPWTAADLQRDRSWIEMLSREDVQELDAAMRQACARGLSVFQIRREDFTLPRLAPRLRQRKDELEHGRGVVLIRGLPVADYSADEARMIYWGIGTHLGVAVSQNASGELFTDVKDQGVQGYGGTAVRGYMTSARLNFHVDFTDVVGLLCLGKAREGGHSSIASSIAIYEEICAQHPELLDVYERGFYFDRKNEQRPAVSPVSEERVPVFSWVGSKLTCFYNRDFFRAAAQRMGVTLSEREVAALDLFDTIASRDSMRYDMDLELGDMQFLHNYTVVHSRTAYVDHEEPARKRLMVRLWLSMPQGRALAPAVANLYGPGSARQGVLPHQGPSSIR